MTAQMPLARTKEIIVQEVDDECLVYDLNTNKALCLNTISAEIWKRCDGINSVREVADIIGKQMKIKLDEDFIWLAIADLEKNKLLAEKANRPTEFENLSRRKVLFKYALPSLMLPIIASIVAPSAVMAQSTALLAIGMSCSSNGQCGSGNCTTTSMLCCVPGVSPFADGSDICASPGTCADFNAFCCSGPVVDLGVGPCGGAGTFCFCA